MNAKIVFACLAVLLAVSISDVHGKKKGDKAHKKHQCLGIDLVMDDDIKKAWGECHKQKDKKESSESGEGENEPHDHCAMDCLYRKLSLINSEGKLDETKMESEIKKVFPEAAQAGLIADNKECMKEITEKLTTDNECKTFQKYTACHFKSIHKNCHKKEDKKKSA